MCTQACISEKDYNMLAANFSSVISVPCCQSEKRYEGRLFLFPLVMYEWHDVHVCATGLEKK